MSLLHCCDGILAEQFLFSHTWRFSSLRGLLKVMPKHLAWILFRTLTPTLQNHHFLIVEPFSGGLGGAFQIVIQVHLSVSAWTDAWYSPPECAGRAEIMVPSVSYPGHLQATWVLPAVVDSIYGSAVWGTFLWSYQRPGEAVSAFFLPLLGLFNFSQHHVSVDRTSHAGCWSQMIVPPSIWCICRCFVALTIPIPALPLFMVHRAWRCWTSNHCEARSCLEIGGSFDQFQLAPVLLSWRFLSVADLHESLSWFPLAFQISSHL